MMAIKKSSNFIDRNIVIVYQGKSLNLIKSGKFFQDKRGNHMIGLEVVLKPPLRPNSCVGPRDSILEILNIFLHLNPSVRLDFEPDWRF
jgi:hypothetical protein